MSKSWYLSLNGRQLGPLPSEQVQRMASHGQINPETLLRPESQEEWLPAKTWPQLFASASTASPARVAAPAGKRAAATMPRAKAITETSTATPVVAPAVGTIPRGVPVGTPTGVAVGVPVGSAVAVPSAGPPAPAVSAQGPVIIVQAPTSRAKGAPSPTNDEEGAPIRKKKNRTPAMILGGATLAVALGGGLLIAFNPFGIEEPKKTASPATSLAVAATGSEADPSAVDEEPLSQAVPSSEKAPMAKAEGEGQSATAQVDKAIIELQRKVKGWKSAASTYKIGPLRYQVTNVWLAGGAGKGTDKTSEEKPGDKAAAAKFLCVQISLTNIGQAPFIYRGWNGFAAKGTAAALLDGDGNALPLAPATELAAERLKSVSIQPKEAVTDTLVFAAPAGEIETLRLMMPHLTVNGLGAGVFALEIPAAMVSRERPAENAVGPGGEQLAGKAGAPPRQESEFERQRRLLAESLGGEPADQPNEPKPNEPKPNEPKPNEPKPNEPKVNEPPAAKTDDPASEMPEDDNTGDAKPETKDKPSEPNLKSLIDGSDKKSDD